MFRRVLNATVNCIKIRHLRVSAFVERIRELQKIKAVTCFSKNLSQRLLTKLYMFDSIPH